MSVRVLTGIDQVAEAVGTHVGRSQWHEIDQPRIDRFAEVTGDHQWIHVDPARASPGAFGGTIAHGFLTLAMLPVMVWQVYRIDGLTMEVNYGADRVRFPAPVPAGARVRATVEFTDLDRTGIGARLTTRVSVEREYGDKPVCVADTVTLLVP